MLRQLITTLLALMLGLATSASQAADDCIVASGLYEDASARMSLTDVQKQSLQPSTTFVSKGYSRSAFWLRITIDPSRAAPILKAGQEDRLFVRIQPSYLDDVRIYDPAYPSTAERVNGDHYPWADGEAPSVNYVFPVPRGSQPRDIWVRMKTTSTSLMRVQVLDEKALLLAEKTQDSVAGIYLGLLIILVLWPILIWASDRDHLSGIFVFKQLIILLQALAVLGYWRMLLSPVLAPLQIDFSGNLFIVGFGLSSVIFHYYYFLQFEVKRWVRYWILGLMLAYPVCLAFLFSGDIYSAVRINTACLSLLSVSFIIVPMFGIRWKAMREPVISFRTMMAIHLTIFLIAWIFFLPAFGILSTMPIAPYISQSYGAVSGALFLLFLKHRNRMIRETRLLEFARIEANFEAEKNKREEQSKFLYMLTHEIKTALSVIRIAFGNDDQYKKYRGHVSEAISDISDVIDRTLVVEKFDSAQIEVRNAWLDMATLVREQASLVGVNLHAPLNLEIYSDPNLIRRIVANLIDNAVKYGEDKSPINISLSVTTLGNQPAVQLSIENKVGPVGFPDSQRVFEKYYRAPHAHSRTGSGLGLYLVHHLARLLGGSVEYRPTLSFVSFVLTLPVSGATGKNEAVLPGKYHE